ncbi:PQQ-dependent sugar dehydrogenase, partial [Candidatus Bipolaricaulota bacterium]|nr:PQQ-dependent sugar dehydrogenase [Candidatus Bipolaricaulota bacterium]
MINEQRILTLFFLGLFAVGFFLTGVTARAQKVETIIGNLDTVWELAWGPSGNLYMSERQGNLLVWDGNELRKIGELPVVERGESGLMGLALDPEFQDNRLMYACFTRRSEGNLENVVERFRVTEGEIRERELLLAGMNASSIHDGCRLTIGPEKKLLVTMGDSARGSLAQDKQSLNGKVLRIDRTGDIPEGNPFPESPVFTLGHRNPQGIDIQPATGEIYISEHGP